MTTVFPPSTPTAPSLAVRAAAVVSCLRFAREGASLESRRILLYVGILAVIWPARRPRLLNHLQRFLADRADAGHLRIQIRPATLGDRLHHVEFAIRAGDRADYQTLWECLNREVYAPPVGSIEYVFDGGANVGLFAIATCRLLPIRELVAVEPDHENLDLLRSNLAAIAGATVVAAALDDSPGEARFARLESNTGHVVTGSGRVVEAQTYAVRCEPASSLIPSTWDMTRTWLKLDVEGAEYRVLPEILDAGMRPVAISMEIHDYDTLDGQQLVRLLEDADYRVTMLDPGSPLNTCRQVSAIHVGSSPTAIVRNACKP